eukprot:TRINITY_DN7973_c0_g1_i1.p1 TRINITY_DN7973_c0_g1~~TRINITY_DN7973_c0_g1_i1.p1  ORF type:complete len:209 (+),score=34.75 TRINITY_DN7973_c0_g1_i1:78-704(+)
MNHYITFVCGYFLILSIFLNGSQGFIFQVEPHEEICWKQKVEQHDSVAVLFKVIKGGFLDIDIVIWSPENKEVYQNVRETEGHYTFRAEVTGSYVFCFSNRMSTLTSKVVSFEVNVVDDIQNQIDQDFLKDEHVDPLLEQAMQITELLHSVQAEQRYTRMRDIAHTNTNESTHARVLWWSIFESIVLITMSFWQVYYLKRYFEDQRPV